MRRVELVRWRRAPLSIWDRYDWLIDRPCFCLSSRTTSSWVTSRPRPRRTPSTSRRKRTFSPSVISLLAMTISPLKMPILQLAIDCQEATKGPRPDFALLTRVRSSRFRRPTRCGVSGWSRAVVGTDVRVCLGTRDNAAHGRGRAAVGEAPGRLPCRGARRLVHLRIGRASRRRAPDPARAPARQPRGADGGGAELRRARRVPRGLGRPLAGGCRPVAARRRPLLPLRRRPRGVALPLGRAAEPPRGTAHLEVVPRAHARHLLALRGALAHGSHQRIRRLARAPRRADARAPSGVPGGRGSARRRGAG